MDRIARSSHDAANCKYEQPANDNRATPNAIGQHGQRDLQPRLGQAVSTHRKSDQDRRSAIEAGRIQRQHRQQREQSEHSQHHDKRNDADSAPFGWQHCR